MKTAIETKKTEWIKCETDTPPDSVRVTTFNEITDVYMGIYIDGQWYGPSCQKIKNSEIPTHWRHSVNRP